MNNAYICDAIRTPIGRYAGALASVRPDDLGAIPIKSLLDRNPKLNSASIDDVIYGCANQAGEDNRNIARMSLLLAGLPVETPGTTINRLCGSGMDAVGIAARAIKADETNLMIAGGVESMSRAPFVLSKSTTAYGRNTEMYDTTIGWRFINKLMAKQYGTDSMPETAENVAAEFKINREDQDTFAYNSQQRYAQAQSNNLFSDEIIPVVIPQRKGKDIIVDKDEHPRPDSTIENLAKLATPFKENGTVTAGNASGVNDGACALLLASDNSINEYDLTPKAKFIGMATAGVEPRIMGIGPVAASRKVLKQTGLTLNNMDVIEINEAFAAQSLAVLRELELPDDAEHVNPNGGAIALGHPLGMSGARLISTAMYQLHRTHGRYALCSMCIGVGQGIAVIIEKI